MRKYEVRSYYNYYIYVSPVQGMRGGRIYTLSTGTILLSSVKFMVFYLK